MTIAVDLGRKATKTKKNINIGSFFLMLLDQYGIKLYIRDVVSTNLCGVEDSMENYQTYLISYSAVMVFESYGILFFFVTHISISRMIFMLNYAFIRILFSLRIHLLAVKMSDRQAFRSQDSQIAVTDPI